MLKCPAYVEKLVEEPEFDSDTGCWSGYHYKAFGKCMIPETVSDVECEGNCDKCKWTTLATEGELNKVKEFLHKKQFSLYDIAQALYSCDRNCNVPYIAKCMREGVQ